VDTLSYIVLVPMVYAAAAVFIAGMVIRLAGVYAAPKNPATLQIYPQKKARRLLAVYDTFFFPTVRRHKPLLWVFLMAFHISLALLIIGHLELFKAFAPLQVIAHEVFIGGGWTGLVILVCIIYFLFRRFHSPVREVSVPEDYLLLILLLLTVLFGSQMNWARNWYGYGEFGVGAYREYLLSLLTLKPELPYDLLAGGHSFMLVLHVFFANLFLMAFPFSQLMHSVFSLPMNNLRRG
jgi:[DsrC]-trisulfide reductase subunit M